MKKKKKRDADPARQDYARILKESGIDEHETESGSKNSIFEITNTPDVEAHAVAAALGLPAQFDPTLKPFYLDGSKPLKKVESEKSDVTSLSQGSLSPDSRPSSPGMVMKSPKRERLESPNMSGEESSDDDEEGEFEAVPGHLLLGNESERPEIEKKKKKLHEMEVGEAAALAAGRKASVGSVSSSGSLPGGAPIDEDDDED
jgi:hypothetical protein